MSKNITNTTVTTVCGEADCQVALTNVQADQLALTSPSSELAAIRDEARDIVHEARGIVHEAKNIVHEARDLIDEVKAEIGYLRSLQYSGMAVAAIAGGILGRTLPATLSLDVNGERVQAPRAMIGAMLALAGYVTASSWHLTMELISPKTCAPRVEGRTEFLNCSLNNHKVSLLEGMSEKLDEGTPCAFSKLASHYFSQAEQNSDSALKQAADLLNNTDSSAGVFSELVKQGTGSIADKYCADNPNFIGLFQDRRFFGSPGGCLSEEKQTAQAQISKAVYDALFADCSACFGEEKCKAMVVGEVDSAGSSEGDL